MSSSEIETPTQAPSFAPTTDEPLTAQEAFDRLQTDVATEFPSAVDLIVAAEQPQPIGRSWSFDWAQHRFVKPQGALGPKPTTGLETLSEWIEKALHTARGAHPIHPDGYGLNRYQRVLFGGELGTVPPDFEDRIREALTFHPNIEDITDFVYDYDTTNPDDESMAVRFSVVLTNGTVIDQSSRLSVTL